MANSVDDETDLTTLVGENDKYRALIEAKFQSEYGNVTWGAAQLMTKDEFLDNYGSGNPAVRNLLMAWITHYALGDRFKQAPDRSPRHGEWRYCSRILVFNVLFATEILPSSSIKRLCETRVVLHANF